MSLSRLGRAMLAALFAAMLLSGATGAAAADQPPVRVQMTEGGPVFATSSGMTLYTWNVDEGTPGASKCDHTRYALQDGKMYGVFPLPLAKTRKTCADKWPAFLAAADARAGGDWSLIPRDDGARQWAYQGHPLYTSVKDHRPGEVNGEPLNIRARTGWAAAKAPLDFPPGFKLVRRLDGLVLATADGRTAYVRRGARIQRTASGSSELLQPIAAPGFGTVGGKWSIVDSGAGAKQYAFNGEALYVLADGFTAADIEGGGWALALYRRATPLPPQIRTRVTVVGNVYTAADGKTLYMFSCAEQDAVDLLTCDDPGDAAVYWSALCGTPEECSRRWRPYRAPANARAVGEWSIEAVSDPAFLDSGGVTAPPGTPKVKAWAYRGKPLYTYVEDEQPGDTFGHAIQYWDHSAFTVVDVPGKELDF